MRDERPLAEGELAELLVIEVDARDVGGHEVGRELDAAEGAPERPGDGACEGGLAGAGDVLEEDVAFAEEGDERETNDLALADDDALDARLHAFGGGANGIDIGGRKPVGGGCGHAGQSS